MQQRIRSLLTGLASMLMAVAAAADSSPVESPSMMGFPSSGVAAQRTLEQRFDSQLNASDLREWMKRMSSAATHVGAPHNKANAEFVQQQMRAWGWDAQIETFDVLYPTLKQHALELVAPTKFVASLKELSIAGDSTSTRSDAMGPYHAYGADGDVTADLVYVNFGMPDDYKELDSDSCCGRCRRSNSTVTDLGRIGETRGRQVHGLVDHLKSAESAGADAALRGQGISGYR